MANFIALIIARDVALGFDVRVQGVAAKSKPLTAYASTAVHGCLGKAMDLCGLGSDALRLLPTDGRRRIDLATLEEPLKKTAQRASSPFC